MTEQAWKERFSARVIEKAGLTKQLADELSEIKLDARKVEDDFLLDDDGYELSPEECADEELSCWTD